MMNDSWEKIKEQLKSRSRRKSCTHAKRTPMIVGEAHLSCCEGNAVTCKRDEFAFLLNIIKKQSHTIDQQTSEIKRCHDIMELSEKMNEKMDETVRNNIVNNYNITINQINIGNLLSEQAVDIARTAMKGGNIYKIAFDKLLQLPDTPQKIELIGLACSSNMEDRITYEREIMETIIEAGQKHNHLDIVLAGETERNRLLKLAVDNEMTFE